MRFKSRVHKIERMRSVRFVKSIGDTKRELLSCFVYY